MDLQSYDTIVINYDLRMYRLGRKTHEIIILHLCTVYQYTAMMSVHASMRVVVSSGDRQRLLLCIHHVITSSKAHVGHAPKYARGESGIDFTIGKRYIHKHTQL